MMKFQTVLTLRDQVLYLTEGEEISFLIYRYSMLLIVIIL
jgi:hypothetical protein